MEPDLYIELCEWCRKDDLHERLEEYRQRIVEQFAEYYIEIKQWNCMGYCGKWPVRVTLASGKEEVYGHFRSWRMERMGDNPLEQIIYQHLPDAMKEALDPPDTTKDL